MGKVLITGASGLIGSHVAEYFMKQNIRVACMVRKNSNVDFLKSIGAEIVYGDISDLESLKNAFNCDADYIIHTAAKVGDWGKYEEFYDSNVVGTINVMRAAKFSSVKNITITGSISCYGEESSLTIKNENHPYNPHYKYFLDKIFPSGLNYYRDTKAEANTKAIEYAKEESINLTIIDPAWVYGEREIHSGFYDYLRSIKNGQFIVPGSKKNKFHCIYARDLAKIYYLVYLKKRQGIDKILAVAPKAEYQYKLFDLFCEKAGFKSPYRVSKALLFIPAFFIEFLYTLLKINRAPVLSRARLNIFYDNIEYSSEKLIQYTGYNPDYSLEESIEKTVLWYKENNYL